MTKRLIACMALLSLLFTCNESKPALAAEKQMTLADCIALTPQGLTNFFAPLTNR